MFPSPPPGQKKARPLFRRRVLLGSGGVLSSRAVSSQVLSALMGLTSVFGMGTGGTPSPLPPEIVSNMGLRCVALQTDYLPKVSFVLLLGMFRPRPAPPLSLLLRPCFRCRFFFTPAAFHPCRCGPPASVHRRVLRFLPARPFTRVRLRILTTAQGRNFVLISLRCSQFEIKPSTY